MKLLKPLLASALLALPASPMTVRAEDSDAQKQAIEALRRVQSPRSTAPAAKAPAVKPVDMNRTAPVANPAYVPPSDTAAQQQALEVLRSKQGAKPAPAMVSTPKPPAPKPAAKPVEVRTPAVAVSAPVANPAYIPPSDTDAQKQALEVLRSKQGAKPAPAVVSAPKPVAKPAAKPVEVRTPAVAVSAPVANPAYVPPSDTAAQQKALEVLRSKPVAKPAAPTLVSKATPAPIPAMAPTTKEGKLAELTRRYLNDEVTPREYHTQRAKILAD